MDMHLDLKMQTQSWPQQILRSKTRVPALPCLDTTVQPDKTAHNLDVPKDGGATKENNKPLTPGQQAKTMLLSLGSRNSSSKR